MATPKSKANIGITLLILFLITLATGIMLHLKSHGIIIQPRSVLKIIHWSAGLAMTVFCVIHALQFWEMLKALKNKFKWFWSNTWILTVAIFLTVATGIIKGISPVRIPHLGLWHYALGMVMFVLIALHLVRGLPSWNRLRKIK